MNRAALRDLQTIRTAIRAEGRVGLDTEFHAERSYIPKLYLVQLRTGDDIWIVDPLKDELLDELRDDLLAVEWIVHGGSQDLRILNHRFGAVPERVWDTQIAAGLVSPMHFPAGFDHLVQTFLGVDIEKTATLSDWSRRPLTDEQVRYAGEDVLHLIPLWDELRSRVDDRGRSSWLAAACDEARDQAVSADLDEIWRRFPGIRKLTPRQAAVLQELARWREQEAQHRGIPARSITGHGTLVAIARSSPTTLAPLEQNRRMSRGLLKRYGGPILDSVKRGLRRPEFGLPHFVRRNTEAAITIEVLRAVTAVLARNEQFGRRLLFPDPLLERYLVDPNLEPGWRKEVFQALNPVMDGTMGIGLIEKTAHVGNFSLAP